jgi:phosphatidylinositol glycan class O
VGLALFARGFLLTRVELPQRSACADYPHADGGAGCWAPAPFSKAVLLVVDGLRWDVAAPGGAPRAQAGRTLALPRLAALAERRGSLLAPFWADPPTTTQTRLRALLTGSLPAFLEVGASFGGGALAEDNVAASAARAGLRVVHAGDDAWLRLFPASSGVLAASHPFPSLDVRDLHTLDRGVAALLPALLGPVAAGGGEGGSWDVLVAHFLGVDHAGHTYGWDSGQMADKLAEIDQARSRRPPPGRPPPPPAARATSALTRASIRTGPPSVAAHRRHARRAAVPQRERHAAAGDGRPRHDVVRSARRRI